MEKNMKYNTLILSLIFATACSQSYASNDGRGQRQSLMSRVLDRFCGCIRNQQEPQAARVNQFGSLRTDIVDNIYLNRDEFNGVIREEREPIFVRLDSEPINDPREEPIFVTLESEPINDPREEPIFVRLDSLERLNSVRVQQQQAIHPVDLSQGPITYRRGSIFETIL
jgi:hypothetical protein